MLYELSCLISPDLSQEQAEEFIKKLETMLAVSGKIVKKDPAKKIGLAYPIKQQTSAFLLSIMFESTPEKMEVLKNKLDKDSGIIRFLLIKTKIEEVKPPRTAIKTDDKESKDIKLKEKEEIKPAAETPVEGELLAGKAIKKPKEGATKVEMEKIETELNKILDESQ